MYITNGTQAHFYTLLARTSDEPGYHSFSLFVVPANSTGVTVSRKLDKLGVRISDTADLFFDNVRVPAANLIGKEGEGFVYQMMQFQHERFSLLPLACTAARDIIDMTVEHIRQVSMGKLLASRVLIKVADGCLQMYGGLGFMNEMLISRYYRDARGLASGGGADEVMREVLVKLEGY